MVGATQRVNGTRMSEDLKAGGMMDTKGKVKTKAIQKEVRKEISKLQKRAKAKGRRVERMMASQHLLKEKERMAKAMAKARARMQREIVVERQGQAETAQRYQLANCCQKRMPLPSENLQKNSMSPMPIKSLRRSARRPMAPEKRSLSLVTTRPNHFLITSLAKPLTVQLILIDKRSTATKRVNMTRKLLATRVAHHALLVFIVERERGRAAVKEAIALRGALELDPCLEVCLKEAWWTYYAHIRIATLLLFPIAS
mmetsp:Transcript_51370/g.80311  ORF Transcript_51370/g.80311 Transcript_51370/m.80311 type:complete len:256 (-) Transcript_51370:50-817(-)